MGEILTLADACDEIVDCAHKTAPIDESGEYFAVGTPAMRGNVINYQEARRVNRTTFERWTTRLRPRFGDLLLAREAPVGPVVRIPDAEDVAPGQRTVLLRARKGVVDSEFLFYYLTSPAVQARLHVKASGSTVPHLNVADVRTLEAGDVPPFDAQRGIAEVLGALDGKIAANECITNTVRDLLMAEFEALGVLSDDFDGSEEVLITELVEVNPRNSLREVENPVYLDMKNLPDSSMTVSNWSNREARGGARFTNGDTLLARITPCLENGKTGFVDFLEPGQVGIGSTEFIVMRPLDGVPAVLPYFLAKSRRFRDFAIKHMVGTSGRQRLSATDVGSFVVTRPSEEKLRKFDELTEPLMRRVHACVVETRCLSAARDELLPLLLSGMVSVRDAEATVAEVL